MAPDPTIEQSVELDSVDERVRTLHDSLFRDQAFHPVIANDLLLHAFASDMSVDACLARPTRLRFLWLSDVQLRQRSVTFMSRRFSSLGDRFQGSFQHNDAQEEFDWAVYTSLVAATNRANALIHEHRSRGGASKSEPLISFMIHTGDAVDAGMIEELYEFVTVSNMLKIPWLNVVGNHDTRVFGNANDKNSWTRQASPVFVPIASLQDFLELHTSDASLPRSKKHFELPRRFNHIPTRDGRVYETDFDDRSEALDIVLPGSKCHGFDFGAPDLAASGCMGMPGHYVVEPPGSGVVLLVLQSSSTSRWGQGAGFEDPSQVAWLDGLGNTLTGRRILVFSHHRVEEYPAAVIRIFDRIARRNALVFLTGHEHTVDVAQHSLAGRTIYEMNSSSMLAFPQVGRLVEVNWDETGGCLATRAYTTSTNMSLLHQQPTAHELDLWAEDCLQAGAELSAEQLVTCGHVGAMADASSIPSERLGFSIAQSWMQSAVVPLMVPRE